MLEMAVPLLSSEHELGHEILRFLGAISKKAVGDQVSQGLGDAAMAQFAARQRMNAGQTAILQQLAARQAMAGGAGAGGGMMPGGGAPGAGAGGPPMPQPSEAGTATSVAP